jgi:hypothetical protein
MFLATAHIICRQYRRMFWELEYQEKNVQKHQGMQRNKCSIYKKCLYEHNVQETVLIMMYHECFTITTMRDVLYII